MIFIGYILKKEEGKYNLYEGIQTPRGDAPEMYTFDTLLAARSFAKKSMAAYKKSHPKAVTKYTEMIDL